MVAGVTSAPVPWRVRRPNAPMGQREVLPNPSTLDHPNPSKRHGFLRLRSAPFGSGSNMLSAPKRRDPEARHPHARARDRRWGQQLLVRENFGYREAVSFQRECDLGPRGGALANRARSVPRRSGFARGGEDPDRAAHRLAQLGGLGGALSLELAREAADSGLRRRAAQSRSTGLPSTGSSAIMSAARWLAWQPSMRSSPATS